MLIPESPGFSRGEYVNLPEVKKYLGGRLRVRRLTRVRLRRALRSHEYAVHTLFVPKIGDDAALPYVAFVNVEHGRLFAVLVNEQVVTPAHLDVLLHDVAEEGPHRSTQ